MIKIYPAGFRSCICGFLFLFSLPAFSQNVGIGTASPEAKLHIKGSVDTSQLVIDANSIQSNLHPLIKLRSSSGTDLLWIHSDDTSNVFMGLQSGLANQVNGNLANGMFNSFMGSRAGKSNVSGSSNTGIGYAALILNSSGDDNTANGAYALYSNTSGSQNTAAGSSALYSNTYGNYNTAVGRLALFSNTTGSSNTAIGTNSLQANGTGTSNTATGKDALYANTSGSYNTANGGSALANNLTGNNNAAFGYAASYNNQTGILNTAFGDESFVQNTSGSLNTAVGYSALYATTASSNNTALGSRAGDSYNMGWNNTLIGANSDVNAAGIFNSAVLGQAAIATASNQVRIGNSSVTSIGGFTSWTNISDGRVKTNIKENVPGLAFINKLKPVTYHLNLDAIESITGKTETIGKDGKPVEASAFEITARQQKEQILYTGFVAQEVETAAKQVGFNFSGVDAPKNTRDLYGLRYAEFVAPLVKAVQELSEMNIKLQASALARKQELVMLEKEVEKQIRLNAELQTQIENYKARLQK